LLQKKKKEEPSSNLLDEAKALSKAASRKRVKRIIRILVILTGILLLVDALFIAIVANFDGGLVVLGVFAVALIAYGVLWQKDKIAKWVHIAVILVCISLITFSGFLAVYGSNDSAEFNEDAVIVLGAAVHGDEVSLTLARRLDKAVEYHASNPQALIVVSGGRGPQESITEAEAMQQYLVARGIPAEKIILEDSASSTIENLLFSDTLLRQEFPSSYTAVLITTDFHVYRAASIAERMGISARHLGAASAWYAIPVNYMREMFAVVYLWVFPPEIT